MKLSELTEDRPPSAAFDLGIDWKIPVVQMKDDTVPSERGDRVGIGRQARVYEFPNHPGAVIKHISIDPEPKEDPHANFINLALHHQDNPFFPKIYNTKIYVNKNEISMALVVQMEKLHPIASNALSEVGASLLASLGIGPDSTEQDQHGSQNIDNRLWHAFESSTRRMELAENTKNPHLAKAIYVIEPFFRKFHNDISSQNLMVRLTSAGPHLVFTDPF